jgi:hypothetical protein
VFLPESVDNPASPVEPSFDLLFLHFDLRRKLAIVSLSLMTDTQASPVRPYEKSDQFIDSPFLSLGLVARSRRKPAARLDWNSESRSRRLPVRATMVSIICPDAPQYSTFSRAARIKIRRRIPSCNLHGLRWRLDGHGQGGVLFSKIHFVIHVKMLVSFCQTPVILCIDVWEHPLQALEPGGNPLDDPLSPAVSFVPVATVHDDPLVGRAR